MNYMVFSGQSIQEKIDTSHDGDTITVNSGTYHEELVINKNITLIGESKDKASMPVISSLDGIGVIVCDSTPVLKNFVISNCNSVNVQVTGKNTHAVFEYCKIHSSKITGVAVLEKGNASFVDCDIHDNGRTEDFDEHNGCAEVVIIEGASAQFKNCRVHDTRSDYLFGISTSGKGFFSGCNFYNGEEGFSISNNAIATFENCRMHDVRVHGNAEYLL